MATISQSWAQLSLDWFRAQIAAAFEVTSRGRLGPADGDDKSIRILNRVIQWTDSGIEYEADQRHAELIVQQLGLNPTSKPANVPSVQCTKSDEEPLEPSDAVMYRALAARANYISQDRIDVCFVVKELCCHMSNPRQGHIETPWQVFN